MKVYTKQHLLARLREEGLPCSYRSLLNYEKLGLFPKKSNSDTLGVASTWRFYSLAEIDKIVEKIREYKQTKNA